MKRLLALFFFLYLFFPFSKAQDKSKARFGDLSTTDFTTKIYPVDSNANAIVIADIGSSEIEGNSKGFFSLVFKHYRRVHVLHKNGYNIANISIPVYNDGNGEEKVDKLKAVTYNFENGKITETVLDNKSDVYKERLDKKNSLLKFTFPNVKEGSIIELEYTIVSDFLDRLKPWEFQGAYPRLWSEYNLRLPSFLGYVFLLQGYLPFHINSKKNGNTNYNVIIDQGVSSSDRVKINSLHTDYRWVIKDAPGIKEEDFVSTVNNYISKIQFQHSEYREPIIPRKIMGSWQQLSDDLMKYEFFGEALDNSNSWLSETMYEITRDNSTGINKAKKIYEWVRDNIVCTEFGNVTLSQSIKNVLKKRNGSVAEINMLLAAMMRYAGIDADPVLLSTKENGFVYPEYPILEKFNYVLCRIKIAEKSLLLDASEPKMGFGYLPLRCYNGQARVISDETSAIELESDSVVERSMTSVFIVNDAEGKIVGSVQQTPGYYKSLSIRNQAKERALNYFEELGKDIREVISISNEKIDSADNYESSLMINFDFDVNDNNSDILYFKPMMFGSAFTDNPFKSTERFYPVEIPYAIDNVYSLRMEVPTGYEIDELPEQVVVKLNNEDEGFFEYRIINTESTVSFRSRLVLKRTYFAPEEYQMLREFISLVVKKHNEQIVFKKKK